MDRIGYIYRIKPELKEEYKELHDKIWPEMINFLKDSGIKKYSIFFRKDGLVFTFIECESYKKYINEIVESDTSIKWEKEMDKYFIKEDKSIVGPEIEMLEEIFYMD